MILVTISPHPHPQYADLLAPLRAYSFTHVCIQFHSSLVFIYIYTVFSSFVLRTQLHYTSIQFQ